MESDSSSPAPQPSSPPPPPPRIPRILSAFGDDGGPEPDIVELRSDNRWDVIDELIDYLVMRGQIKPHDRSAIAEGVKKREASMSTGIGFGVAIPHASSNLVPRVIAVIGRSAKGVQFDALDQKPVRLVALFIVPQGEFQKHQEVLANIAKLLHRSGL